MDKVEEAVAAWRKVRADFEAHRTEGTRLKELEIVARHAGKPAGDEEAAYRKHQDGWYELYRAEKNAAMDIARALGMTDAEAKALGDNLR